MRLTGIVWDLVVPVLLIAVLVSPVRAVERNSLTFSKMDDSIHSDVTSAILEQAYAKLGITVSFKALPASRALIDSVNGITDGSCHRVYAIGEIYKTLRRVQPSLYSVHTVAYGHGDSIFINNPTNLRRYRIGSRHGIVYVQLFVKKHGISTTQVQTYEQLFRMLEGNRLDFILVDQVHGALYLKQHGPTGIRPASRSLVSEPLYHYLNEKHADLVPAISKIIAEMKQSGEIDRIVNEVLEGKNGNAPPIRTPSRGKGE